MTPEQYDQFMARLDRIEIGICGLLQRIDGAAPRAAAPSATSAGGVLPNYGKAKGQPIVGASIDTLEYYAAGARRSLADESKAKWHAKERAMLAAIEAEIARQRGAEPTQPVNSGFADEPPF